MKPSIKNNAHDFCIFNVLQGSSGKPGKTGTMMGPIWILADE
jgi:hypothetical protein